MWLEKLEHSAQPTVRKGADVCYSYRESQEHGSSTCEHAGVEKSVADH